MLTRQLLTPSIPVSPNIIYELSREALLAMASVTSPISELRFEIARGKDMDLERLLEK